MHRRIACRFAIIITATLLTYSIAFAGNNVHGVARLSWTYPGTTADLSTVASDTLLLYLSIDGAPDVRRLSVDLRWSPDGVAGSGYSFVPSADTITCAYISYAAPNKTFDADSAYNSTIVQSVVNEPLTCVVYEVVGAARFRLPATFCLVAVKAIDSNGIVDNLAASGIATLFGGIGSLPLVAESILPTVVTTGTAQHIEVSGHNFTASTTLSIVDGTKTFPALSVSVATPSILTATVPALPSTIDYADVVVSTASDTFTLQHALKVVAANDVPTRLYDSVSVIVQFKPDVIALPQASRATTALPSVDGRPSALAALQSCDAVSVGMLTPTATPDNLVYTDLFGVPHPLDQSQLDFFVVTLADTNVWQAIGILKADTANVITAYPNWLGRQACDGINDSLYCSQWHLANTGQYPLAVPGQDIHALAMWTLAPEVPPTDVVVLDSGLDPGHPEFNGRVVWGPNCLAGGPSYDDNNESHGTAVAGIIAAARNNFHGVAGINPDARIVAVKVNNAAGDVPLSAAIAGLDWARTQGYVIVNMSFGYEDADPGLGVAVKNAFLAGMALFVATQNQNQLGIYYPAAFRRSAIAVGASYADGTRWDDNNIDWTAWYGHTDPPQGRGGSNYGQQLRFLAPGGRFIATTLRMVQGGYTTISPQLQSTGFGGTSAAAPVASGIASMLYGLSPFLDGERLAFLLSASAHDLNAPPLYYPGWDEGSGYGIIDGAAAVGLLQSGRQWQVVGSGTLPRNDVLTEGGFSMHIGYWPGLTSTVYPAYRHTIQCTMQWPSSYAAVPLAMASNAGSYGAGREGLGQSGYDGIIDERWWVPAAEVVAVTVSTVTLQTFVYDLRDPVSGAHVAWFPTAPSGTGFTAVGFGFPQTLGVTDATFERPGKIQFRTNPVHNVLRLRFTGYGGADVRTALFDLSGRRIRELDARHINSDVEEFQWNLGAGSGGTLRGGVYFLRTEIDGMTRTFRFVKL